MDIAREVAARRKAYHHASDEDLRAIDEAREAVRRGEAATEEEVQAVLGK